MNQAHKKNIAYLDPNDDLKTLITIFHSLKISHAPVIDNTKLVGIVSKTDFIDYIQIKFHENSYMSLQEFFAETKVKQLMTQPIVEAQVHDTTMTILEKLSLHKIGSVVLKDGQKVAGIITEKDMIKYFTQAYEQEMTFSEKLSNHIIQWLDKNGIIRISKILADIGI